MVVILDDMDSKSAQMKSEAEVQRRETQKEPIPAELIPLFSILITQPAKEHDFKTCPVCKRYGTVEI
jgi:hypothetical protein